MKNNKNISLEEIGNELPFCVPEDYFNQFALQIENQIGYKKINTPRFLKHWMYMAAMFVGIFVMGGIFYSVNQRSVARNSENYESYVLSQVDERVVMDYYVNNSSK